MHSILSILFGFFFSLNKELATGLVLNEWALNKFFFISKVPTKKEPYRIYEISVQDIHENKDHKFLFPTHTIHYTGCLLQLLSKHMYLPNTVIK